MFESKKNNVWFNIGNQLTANTSSTLLTILGGKETLFGADFGINDITKHFKLTLTKFVGGVISISEVVKVTAKSGNSLTIVRAYEPCPLNANATVMTQSPQAFDVGDFAYMNITASDLIELGALIDTKQNNCVMLTKSANYTFTGAEANNTCFSTNTTSGNITYTLNPALFPTTNGMYEFTICKSTNDANTVIIDVGAGKTIDTAQTYILTKNMETVTIRIASSTFVKVIASTNRTVVIAPLPTTQSTFIVGAGENIVAGNALSIYGGYAAFKTDASNSSKINFIGFATNTVSAGGNVIVDTSGVSNTQTGLTIGSDYYLGNTPGAISTTPGTNVVSVGKAISTTGIEILNSDNYTQNIINKKIWWDEIITPMVFNTTGITGYSATSSNAIINASTSLILTGGAGANFVSWYLMGLKEYASGNYNFRIENLSKIELEFSICHNTNGTTRVGFIDAGDNNYLTGGLSGNGRRFYFQINTAASTEFVNGNGTASTTTNLSTVPSGNLTRYKLIYDKVAGNIQVYINNGLKATIITNLPTTAMNLSFGAGLSSGSQILNMKVPSIKIKYV